MAKTQLFDVKNKHPLVTDDDFSIPFNQLNVLEKRKKGENILQKELNIQLVSQVVNDPMHDFDLGVGKRFVQLYAKKTNHRAKIDEKHAIIRCRYQPTEFQRRVRPISEWRHWKASEYKNFIQYWGVVSLKGVVSQEKYEHFMLLSLSARMLSRVEFRNYWGDVVKSMLERFLINIEAFYDKKNLVCSVHKLMHLADECILQNAPMYSFSAYPFESFMGSIMKLASYSHAKILSQIHRRVAEIQNAYEILKPHKRFEEMKVFNLKANVISKIYYFGMVIQTKFNDANFIDDNDRHVTIIKITKDENDQIILTCQRMLNLRNAFESPFSSNLVNVYLWTKGKYSREHLTLKLNNLKNKLCILPYSDDEDELIILPMSKEM